MLSVRELVSHLQLYLSLILSYHPAWLLHVTANYCPTPVPQIVSCQYWFLNSVRRFFAKLNRIKAGMEHNKKELKYYGIETRLSRSSLKPPTSLYYFSLKYLSFDSKTWRVLTTKNNHFRSLVLVTSHKYVMTWNTSSCLLSPSKVTGDPGEFFFKSLLTVSVPSENYFQNFGENLNNSLTRLPQGGPSL